MAYEQSDNHAIMNGYTKHVLVTTGDGMASFAALIQPDTDYDTRFKAYDTDNQEWLYINGYNCEFEDLE